MTQTFASAERIAALIKRYWGERGYVVSSYVMATCEGTDGTITYQARTDLVDGLPRDFKQVA